MRTLSPAPEGRLCLQCYHLARPLARQAQKEDGPGWVTNSRLSLTQAWRQHPHAELRRFYPFVFPQRVSPSFLHRIAQRDEPPTAGEADLAGPWRILEMPGKRFGVFRLGESPEREHRPAAVFQERWLALLAAAVLPGTGRDAAFRLHKESGPGGFAIETGNGGEPVGHSALFDEPGSRAAGRRPTAEVSAGPAGLGELPACHPGPATPGCSKFALSGRGRGKSPSPTDETEFIRWGPGLRGSHRPRSFSREAATVPFPSRDRTRAEKQVAKHGLALIVSRGEKDDQDSPACPDVLPADTARLSPRY